MSDERYAIGELARRAGVSRRTVRFYVQRGLIPQPLGRGRGEHYGSEHLERLLRVKALQQQGVTLDAIARRLSGAARHEVEVAFSPAAALRARLGRAALPELPGEAWIRQPIAQGYELHCLGRDRALTESELARLAGFVNELIAAREES